THLTINYSESSYQEVAECDSYDWMGMTYTESGLYINTGETAAGCAKVDSLQLTINGSLSSYTEVTECNSFEWNGEEYNVSGLYINNGETPNGCAIVDSLQLTINYDSSSYDEATACDSYEWMGMTYTESGLYINTGETAVGCAKVDSLQLTINYSSSSYAEVEACESFEWMGVEYLESGLYIVDGLNDAGCVQTDSLDLTITLPTESTEEVATCSPYEWNGEIYTETGLYSYVDESGVCPHTFYLDLTIGGDDCNNDGDCENFSTFYVNHGPGVSGSNLYRVNFVGNEAQLEFLTNVQFEAHIAYSASDDVVYLANANGSFVRAYSVSTNVSLGDLPLDSGLNGLYAVVYNDADGLLYLGSDNANKIYTVDPNGDGSHTFFANGAVQGGDLAFQNGKLFLGTRDGNKLYEIVEAGSPILVGSIPANINGLAAANNSSGAVMTNSGSSVMTEVDVTSTGVVRTYDITLGGAVFTANNGDMASGCGDGGDLEDCTNFKYFYIANNTPGVANGTVFEGTIVGGDVILTELFESGINGHIAVNEQDELLYVVNGNGSSISTYDMVGNLLLNTPLSGLNSTYAVAYDPTDEKLFIGSANQNKVYKVDPITGAKTVFAASVPVSGGDIILSNGEVFLIERGNTVSKLYNITSGDDVFVANIAANINGASGTPTNGLLVAHGAGSNSFVKYDIDGSNALELTARDSEGNLFTLVDGDMAGGCFSGDPGTDDCEFVMYLAHDQNLGVGGITEIYAMTINPDNTTSNTLLTTVDFPCHGIAYSPEGNEGELYLVKTVQGSSSFIVWDIETNSQIGGPIEMKTAGGQNIPNVPNAVYRNGILYAASYNHNKVYLIDPSTGIASASVSINVNGGDLVFDGNGDLWYIQRYLQSFTNLTAGGSFTVPLTNIHGVALMPNGNFMVANGDGGSQFYEVDPAAGALVPGSVFETGISLLWGDLTGVECAIDEDTPPQMAGTYNAAFDTDMERTAVLSSQPNPTAGASKVIFSVPSTVSTTLEVYDMNGRNVGTIFNQIANKDQVYTVDFNGSDLPNGVYIYRLTTNNSTIIEKFMIAR
ncbi:T9SS type A sorting domain-containing protein, partial [Cryomorpha ignava]